MKQQSSSPQLRSARSTSPTIESGTDQKNVLDPTRHFWYKKSLPRAKVGNANSNQRGQDPTNGNNSAQSSFAAAATASSSSSSSEQKSSFTSSSLKIKTQTDSLQQTFKVSSSSSSSSSKKATSTTRVTFSNTTIYYHKTVLGDTSGASSSLTGGLPLALGWKCVRIETISVHDMMMLSSSSSSTSTDKTKFWLSSHSRRRRLRQAGVSCTTIIYRNAKMGYKWLKAEFLELHD